MRFVIIFIKFLYVHAKDCSIHLHLRPRDAQLCEI